MATLPAIAVVAIETNGAAAAAAAAAAIRDQTL